MINVVFDISEHDLSVRMEGHAGYSTDGVDVVCAAASMLIQLLAQIVEDMNDGGKLKSDPSIHLEPGEAWVTCRPLPIYMDDAHAAFLYTDTGFAMLADQYPENVQVEINV